MDAEECELYRIASLLEVGPTRFHVRRQRAYPAEDSKPHVRRNLSKNAFYAADA
jgi:hypothetical protein